MRNMREYTAAGGVVLDAANRVLVIERWVIRNGAPRFEVRLPKGHVEDGETDAEAALRETCEETGYCGLTIIADLGDTITEWSNAVEHVRRIEHYFLMRLTESVRRTDHFPDLDSDEAKFIPRWAPDLPTAAAELTFSSEVLFAQRAQQALAALDAAVQP